MHILLFYSRLFIIKIVLYNVEYNLIISIFIYTERAGGGGMDIRV